MPMANVFNMPADYKKVIDMLRADLADAGIAYIDDAGRFADFHAIRHTFISNLAHGGVHPKTAQRLARHSTITLMMNPYTHLHADGMISALSVLPDLSPQREIATMTGTHDSPKKSLS